MRGQTKIGISDYNAYVLVGVGDIATIAVCKVMSYTNETVMLDCTWTQTSGDKNLPVVVQNKLETLGPNEHKDIFIVVSGPSNEYVGDYVGTVQLEAKPANVSGNPITWGGSTKVHLTVKYLKPAQFQVYNLVLSNSSVWEGDSIIASVSVKNVGEMTGSYTVVFSLDGVPVHSEAVSLGYNQTRTLDYICNANVGSHFLSVGNMTKQFIVNQKQTQTSWNFPTIPVIAISVLIASCSVTAVVGVVRKESRKGK